MKKLIALLLALLMPLCAAAEAYSFSISVSTDDELFSWYLKESLLLAPEAIDAEDAELAIRLMQCILDGLTVDLQIQDQLLALACSINGKPLLDMNIVKNDQEAFLTSSLFPGHAFVSEDASDTTASALQSVLENISLDAIADETKHTAEAWFAALEPTVAAGTFSGDAYEVGVVCRAWTLMDSDIAELVSELLTDAFRASITEIASALDAGDLLQHFDALNAEVAERDTHLYILRVAENEAGEFCGLSLTILRDMHQIATASLGMTGKGIKLVIGLGLTDNNYWWEFTANRRQRNNMTTLSGTSREWLSDKVMDFSYVSTKVAPVSNFNWHCYITKSGKRYLWDASIYEDLDQSGYRYLMSSDGKVNTSTGELDFTIALGDSPYIPASVNVKIAPTTSRIVGLDGLEPILVTAGFDMAQHEDLLEQATALLATRMLKILPADLFVKMMQMNITE